MPRKHHARLVWRGVSCRVTHQPAYKKPGWSKIELRVLKPAGAPVPITLTGYVAYQVPTSDLVVAGGLVPYFTSWLDRQASAARYLAAYSRFLKTGSA